MSTDPATAIPPALDDPGTLVQIDGVRLWCSSVGDGEPLTMLGGFTAGHHIFDFVRPYLAAFRTITWEPRGLGRSDRPAGPYGLDVWARDLHNLLSTLGVERTHLWATAFGNYIGLRFAAQYPDMIGRFIASTDVWHGDETRAYVKFWPVYRAIVENFGTTDEGARMLSSIFDVHWLPWFTEWEAKNIEEVLHADTVDATVGYCLTEADARGDLDGVKAPMLVLQGDHDYHGRLLRPDQDPSFRLMREHSRDLKCASIRDSHAGYVLAQRPEECARIAREFLANAA